MDRTRSRVSHRDVGEPFPEGAHLLVVRHAVRRWFDRHAPERVVTVGLSGGADSLALTAACVAEGATVYAVVVDHGLQAGSADVAETARSQALGFGCAAVDVVSVIVEGPGGPEAAARRARYTALDAARDGRPVLLGHTLDDQAETVLLGLARGSGARSLQGMTEWDPPRGRPLLGVRRADTVGACAELGVEPWQDPHNLDPGYTRVRVRREVLPLLDDVLRGGVAEALARTAEQLHDDNSVLDSLADDVLADAHTEDGLDVAALVKAPAAVRRRVIRQWLIGAGVTIRSDAQLRAVDDLIGDWRGQGPVAVPNVEGAPDADRERGGDGRAVGRLVVLRRHGKLVLDRWTGRPGSK